MKKKDYVISILVESDYNEYWMIPESNRNDKNIKKEKSKKRVRIEADGMVHEGTIEEDDQGKHDWMKSENGRK